MPYRLLNIGQLLFLLPNPELKQKVRILETLNKRFINVKIGTIFNRTCLIEGLFPAYRYIYINIHIYIYIYIYIYIHTQAMHCIVIFDILLDLKYCAENYS